MTDREIIEALVFAADGALAIEDMQRALPELSGETIDGYVAELNVLYGQQGRSFYIERLAGGYLFVTREEFTPYLKLLKDPIRLSNAAMEVLAVIAYKGPCSKAIIDGIRGVDSSSSLKNLLRHQLIDIKAGKPMLYRTSETFLEVFGLGTLADLPDIKQFEEVFGDEES